MLSAAKSAARSLGLDTTALYQRLSAASIAAAIGEQGLAPMLDRLRGILPDISDQYTGGWDRASYERYWELKIRGMHAFQISAIQAALDHVGGDSLVLADIGDSSGNHALYLRGLAPDRVARVISVNLDPVAIDKVRRKGGEAVLCRAEDLDVQGIQADLFMSFEMLEHLTDPIRFLHALATKAKTPWLLATVPYRRRSRFGGADIRLPPHRLPERMNAEEVHVYEFSPEDWQLLARFAGFKPVFTRIYRQYPLRSPLRLTAPLWRSVDYEGFVALFFERDLSFASRYVDW
jgi:SAM-dependent methyltransferase